MTIIIPISSVLLIFLILLGIFTWFIIGKKTDEGFSDEGWEEEEMDLESKKAMAREEK